MRLWTVQPYCVYELLQTHGIYRCNSNLSTLLESETFITAYEWISKQMKKRIGNPPADVKYPVWAWYSVEGKHQKPDMRKSYMKVFEKSALLEIEIPDTEVLLTDFSDWHIILNNGIIHSADYNNMSYAEWELAADKEDAYYDSLSDEEKLIYMQKSWEKVIRSENDTLSPYIQATFWELKKSQIKKSWILRK